MNKFKAVVEYDGTAYHGWQLQKDLPTIQGQMEKTLERIVGKATRVHGSGRTDAGVHAVGQVAHFSTDWSHTPEELWRACNALLPPDIAVRSLEHAADDFHARHSAHSKTYVYQILNRPLRSPLLRLYSWHIPLPLDSSLMAAAAAHLVGSHDFAAFGSPTDGTTSTVREVLLARWDGNASHCILEFTICASGFLRYMVRSIVGTLVMVGRKRIQPEDFLHILESCDRSQSGPTAPPHGLLLKSVEYESKQAISLSDAIPSRSNLDV
ncbi:MAG: tRNA pseudouridine(38-40) synthase TruA [Desulfomonile tiedjei]|nr:tRNA pseudouridine(38-40) synthase TruA [Desulfomonile tiedjei]